MIFFIIKVDIISFKFIGYTPHLDLYSKRYEFLTAVGSREFGYQDGTLVLIPETVC